MTTAAQHTHKWRDTGGDDRLIGDVYHLPVRCACGATAWRYQWGREHHIVSIAAPERVP